MCIAIEKTLVLVACNLCIVIELNEMRLNEL